MQSFKHIIGYTFPFILFFVFFAFYNQWQFSASEMLKTSGLWAISLASITFLVGPLSRFWHGFNALKVFREYWGVTSVIVMLIHFVLGLSVRYHWDIGYALSTRNPYHVGFYTGLTALLWFLLMVIISNRYSMQHLGRWWKWLQTAGYLALLFAFIHFILLETKNGHFFIRRPLGRITFALVAIALVLRIYVYIWSRATKKAEESTTQNTAPPREPTSPTV